jgi:hypothetical protein
MPLHSNSTPPLPATKCSRPQHLPVTARHFSLTTLVSHLSSVASSLPFARSLAAPSPPPSLPPQPNPNPHAFFLFFFVACHSNLPSFERTRIIITTSAATFNKWVPRHVAGRPQLLARASPVCHGYGGLIGDPEEHLVVNLNRVCGGKGQGRVG